VIRATFLERLQKPWNNYYNGGVNVV
jgi:hypothetical protein